MKATLDSQKKILQKQNGKKSLGKSLKNFGKKILKLIFKQFLMEFNTIGPESRKLLRKFRKQRGKYKESILKKEIMNLRQDILELRNLIKRRRDKINNQNDDLCYLQQRNPYNIMSAANLYELRNVQAKKLDKTNSGNRGVIVNNKMQAKTLRKHRGHK